MNSRYKKISQTFFVALAIGLGSCSHVEILQPQKVETSAQSKAETPAESKAPEVKVVKTTEESKPKGVKQVPAPTKTEVPKTTEVSEPKNDRAQQIAQYCQKMDKSFKRYGWGKSDCMNMHWRFHRESVNGNILAWQTFGEFNKDHTQVETTLIMCGIHGDEITPIKFCFDVINYLNSIKKGEIVDDVTAEVANLKGKYVVVAPLVNPDSYFKKRPTRTNANGVDVNRNFPTRDFKKLALKRWEDRYRKDKRRYPGVKANSEPETKFQVNLIYRYHPDKIISVHSPLTMLDYDGPASIHTGGLVGSKANELLIQMSEQAKGYRIKNYPFFPGSLGNYAGNERNIPTYTLELPTSDASKVKSYWKLFKSSVHAAIMKEVKGGSFLALEHDHDDSEEKENETKSN